MTNDIEGKVRDLLERLVNRKYSELDIEDGQPMIDVNLALHIILSLTTKAEVCKCEDKNTNYHLLNCCKSDTKAGLDEKEVENKIIAYCIANEHKSKYITEDWLRGLKDIVKDLSTSVCDDFSKPVIKYPEKNDLAKAEVELEHDSPELNQMIGWNKCSETMRKLNGEGI